MRQSIPFWKMESVGNDFVLIHLDEIVDAPEDAFLAELAIKACSRHFGIGSDGLLAVKPTIGAIPAILLRMFNPDGTEDFCGNGVRCAIRHSIDQGWLRLGSDFAVQHFGKNLEGSVDEAGAFRYVFEGGDYRPEAVPHTAPTELFDTKLFEIDGKRYRGSVLSTGTAHTILPVAELPGDEEFFRVSPKIEHHGLFPERTSVMWVKEDAPSKLRLRIWERGAQETQGCGSGSAAAAIDYLRRNPDSKGPVLVANPGGTLEFQFEAWDGPGFSVGPAHEVFHGTFFV